MIFRSCMPPRYSRLGINKPLTLPLPVVDGSPRRLKDKLLVLNPFSLYLSLYHSIYIYDRDDKR